MIKIKKNLMKVKPYLPGKPIEEVQRELGLEKVIKLASNENSFGPSPLALQALKQSLSEVNRYPDAGCYYLQQKLSAKLGVQKDELIFGNGSDELIILTIKALTDLKDEVIIAKPTFLIYNIASVVSGLQVREVPLTHYKYDLKRMVDRISPRTKIIFIANPDNPTGTYVNKIEVEAFLKKVPEDVIVYFDEAYFEYVQEKDYPDTLIYQSKGNVITSRSFSKIYGLAGLRIGYAVSSKQIIELMNKVREPFNVNSLAQSAALAALDDDKFVTMVKDSTEKGKQLIYSELEKIGLHYIPSVTNFILVEIGKKAKDVYNALLQNGIIVRYMSAWGFDDYIRVTVGTKDENQLFISTLRKILS